MPITEIHKKKRIKNYAVLAVLVGLIAMFFSVTMIKLRAATSNVESTKR